MPMYFVYILYSPSLDKYYVDYSYDPNQRVYKHNHKHKGFTTQTNDWKIVFQKTYPTKREALLREQQIKAWKSRKIIEKLINSMGDG